MEVIITPLILLTTYTFAYEVLIIKSEVKTVESVNQIQTKSMTETQNKIMCDCCAYFKDNLKQVKLKDIQQPVLLCEECQLKFKEVTEND